MIRFTKAKATPPKPKKPKGGKKATLNKLKSFLAQAEPEAVEILVSNFNAQQNAVTYKELREAYLAGGITQKQFEKWQKDYSKLITGTLAPKWEAAATAAAQEVKDKYPYFVYEPSVSAGMDFIKQHGAELVSNLAQEQQQALNAVIQHVSGYTNVTPDEAARIIRPCIGLTKPQALANARYRETVKQAYIKAHPHGKPETAEKRAADAAARYAARQHRYRAQNIARTELAYAYNAGAYGATKDAQAQGYIGDCVKVWLTAYDERVCPICSAMDEERRNMDEAFSNGKLLPPGHPQCRCAVAYEEIENTNLTPAPASGTMDAQGQAQPQSGAAQPAAAKPAEGGYSVSEVLDDISVLPKNQQGVAIRSDGGMVEGLNLTGRRINIGGTEYYEVSGKLTEDAWAAAAQNAKKRGYSQKMDFLMYDQGAGQFRTGDVGLSLDGHRIMTLDQGSFEVYSDYVNKTQYGMGGFFRVRVPATGNAKKDGAAIQTVFDKAGLKSLTADPTDADELLLKKSRIAWQRDPKGMERVRAMNATAREREIDKILRKAGIDDKRVQGMRLKEVFPGYSTYVDDAALAEYKKAGLTHIWSGVGDADSVVAITKSGGFTATNYRVTSGMKKCGASASDDMMTGGSDSVFTRLGVSAPDRYSRSFLGGQYRIIIDPKEMTRTDWYAYKSDNYGNAKLSTAGTCASLPFDARATPVDFIKDMRQSYRSSNEIMFRHGISSDSFIGISCEDDSMRRTLIDKFKASGMTEIHGVPVEDFIQTTQHIKQDSQRGIEGLDFYDPDKPAF